MDGLFTRKKKGEITDFVAVIIFLFVTAVIWQVFLFNQRAVNIKEDIDATINQYVLCLEADGYLSDANCASLINDLSRLGMSDIDLTGTDFATAPKVYGERVTLQVRGKLEVPVFNVAWLRLERTTTLVEINEKRVSVSHGIS